MQLSISTTVLLAVAVSPLLFAAAAPVEAQRPLRILFLSKSSTFEHPSVGQRDGEPSHVDGVLRRLARDNGLELLTTKDASVVNARELKTFDVVIFYTTGDLTRSGGEGPGMFSGDGQPPMGARGVRDLLAWIEAGGGFIGYHSATDTFHGKKGAPSPYLDMLGGEFRTHGQQFEGTVQVVDPKHPTMLNVPARWPVFDEWYLFKNLKLDEIHVLAVLDPGAERERQSLYDLSPYPIAWCRTLGKGRVYYNALGHREDVWDNPVFRTSVVDAIRWAAGRGEARAEPNGRRYGLEPESR